MRGGGGGGGGGGLVNPPFDACGTKYESCTHISRVPRIHSITRGGGGGGASLPLSYRAKRFQRSLSPTN